MQAGSVLAGWGRGKFRDGADKPAGENELEFFGSAEGWGLLDNKLASFADLMVAQEKLKTYGAKLCYHTVSKDPSGSWIFAQDLFWFYTPKN